MTKNILGIVFTVLAVVLFLDFICFIGWVASDQKPVDGFYVGAITTNIIKVVIK